LHAKVLASDRTNVYEFPEFPDYRNDAQKEETVLLFPSKVNEYGRKKRRNRKRKIIRKKERKKLRIFKT